MTRHPSLWTPRPLRRLPSPGSPPGHVREPLCPSRSTLSVPCTPGAPAPDLWWGPWQEVLAGDGQVGQREGLRHLPSRPLPPESCGSPRSVPLLPEAPRPPSQQQHGHAGWPLAFVAPPSSVEAPEGRVVLCFLPRDPSPLQWDRQKQALPARGGEGWSGGSRQVSCGDGRTL